MELLKRFKLQNLVLYSDSLSGEHSAMMYRGAGLQYIPMRSAYVLNDKDFIEFFTYFNSFSYAKWKKYTNAGQIYLSIRVKGAFTIQLFGHYKQGGDIRKDFYPLNHYSLKEYTDIDLPVPDNTQASVLGFQLTAGKNFSMKGGGWYTDVKESDIRDVRISIAAAAFKNESCIKRNVDIMERELFYSDEPCREHFHLRIIDNGRTLDPEDYNSEYITLYPNVNAGSAGGFARGMLESLQAAEKPTHILLIGDDVTISPEAFIRTYTLLALLKDEYADCFISGAMLHYEFQHENVGYVHPDGTYGPNKQAMDMNLWNNVFENGQRLSLNTDSYAGWWYCTIPMEVITEDNLPLPIFIRGGDMEYGLRNMKRLIPMNGICVWHEPFEYKYSSYLFYYILRDRLIDHSLHDMAIPKKQLIELLKNQVMEQIRLYRYKNAELLMRGTEDFLKGIDWFIQQNGEELHKSVMADGYKLQYLDELEEKVPFYYSMYFDSVWAQNPATFKYRLLNKLTVNGNFFLPTNVNRPYNIVPTEGAKHINVYRAAKILNYDYASRKGFLTYRSAEEAKRVLKRLKELVGLINQRYDAVVREFGENYRKLTSLRFWNGYLGLNKAEPDQNTTSQTVTLEIK